MKAASKHLAGVIISEWRDVEKRITDAVKTMVIESRYLYVPFASKNGVINKVRFDTKYQRFDIIEISVSRGEDTVTEFITLDKKRMPTFEIETTNGQVITVTAEDRADAREMVYSKGLGVLTMYEMPEVNQENDDVQK